MHGQRTCVCDADRLRPAAQRFPDELHEYNSDEHNFARAGELPDARDRTAHDIQRRCPMTGRDRIVIVVLGALAVLAAVWLLAVAPEREKASKLGAQVSEAQAQLSTAEGQVVSARTAQAGYATAYASLVSLGKAVPTGQEVPSLIYQLAQASHQKQVEFTSITTGGSSASSSATPVAAAAGFSQMPFTFVFNGSFSALHNLFQQLNRFTLRTSSGGLVVSGRLLTIQSVQLAPATSSGAEQGSNGQLTGTITATAYVLPGSQSLTGGATSTSPAGATQTTSSVSASSSPTTPAVIGAGR
jgi:Tfp pilus assembly protein PilO